MIGRIAPRRSLLCSYDDRRRSFQRHYDNVWLVRRRSTTAVVVVLLLTFTIIRQQSFLRELGRNESRRPSKTFSVIDTSSSSLFIENNRNNKQSPYYLPVVGLFTDLCHVDRNSSLDEYNTTSYRGVLHISRVFKKAATGTFFFQAIVDGILFSEEHNLYPFIHIDKHGNNQPCFDEQVHGSYSYGNYTCLRGDILNVPNSSSLSSTSTSFCEGDIPQPDRPDFDNVNELTTKVELRGNGIWQSYFLPMPIPFNEPCFTRLPLFELTQQQLLPGLHYCKDYSVKGWIFPRLAKSLTPHYQHLSMKDWLWQHRQRASGVVEKYFHLQPWLQDRINQVDPSRPPRRTHKRGRRRRFLPNDEDVSSTKLTIRCLGVHIRLTDKGSGREKKGIEAYLPYLEAYVQAYQQHQQQQQQRFSSSRRNFILLPRRQKLVEDGPVIFLATDDARVLTELLQASPSVLQRSMFRTQPGTLQSSSDLATFSVFDKQRHRINTETLVDIYSLSKCRYLVHGFSAVAEAAVYLNPSLHHRSVNVDDKDNDDDDQGETISRSSLQLQAFTDMLLQDLSPS